PRTSLIPNRFWRILDLICRAHGETNAFVFSLPHKESGCVGDFCHPRFIACMLRLGDLLDLDHGRFCSAVNASLPRLPPTSDAHRAKHEGIKRLLVSPQRVDVRGEYDRQDAYSEAESWFSWLRDELKDQLLRWSEIAPDDTFGSLPSIGTIEARLEG